MAELRRTFTGGRMNKDLDERLVPDGNYTDALNIKVTTSDASNMGTAQTLRGNTQHNTMNLSSGYYGITNNATVVGSIAAPERDCIYYFVADSTDNDIKKDYILEYNTLTERIGYVFVDIFQVNEQAVAASASSDNFLYIPVLTIADVTSNNQNITGVRIGMLVTGSLGGVTYGPSDNVRVSDIIFDTGNNRYKVYLEQDGVSFTPSNGVAENNNIRFIADRVLNFSSFSNFDDTGKVVSAINVIGDFIYWTDAYTEPKRINIETCKLGTGGTEYLRGGGIAGYAAADATQTHTTFLSDTPFFHTRLVQSTGQVGGQGQFIYEVVRKRDQKRAVYMDESHVTVIRKAPTEPLNLNMFRVADDRVPNNSTTANVGFTTAIDWSAYNTADTPVLWEAGVDEPTITFDTEIDFRVGDIILLARQSDTDDATTFTDYSIRAEVIASPVTNPNELSTGPFTIRILSISGNIQDDDLKWYVRLELTDPLFEFKFPRFSYRYRYQDGEYSTFAPWSQVAFLPGKYEYHPKEGYNLGMVNNIRKITLKGFVPQEENMPEDVVAVDLLYKETGAPAVYTVKTIKPTDGGSIWPGDENDLDYDDNGRGAYTLTTDLIHAILPADQILRPWDNVPRKAVAQEISANRLIYGNYTSSYTVSKDPIFQVGLQQTPINNFVDMDGSTGSDFALPSVKSIRTYQVGVVFSDRYGRETPVLTAKGINNEGDESWATVRVPKTASDTRNRLAVKLSGSGDIAPTDIPSWAEFYSWYVKETSVEYYNMAMDRWYHAEDGNIWISFPSSERNKIDLETFLILKKAHGTDVVVHDKARYKVLAIENEAPDYIKTEEKSIGKLYTNGEKTTFGNATRGYPWQDWTYVLVDAAEWNNEFGEPSLWTETYDTLSIRFYGAGKKSNLYEVSHLSSVGTTSGNNVTGSYKVKIIGKFEEDAAFTSTDDTWDTRIDGLAMELVHNEVENRPEFDGRFFVKLARDQVLEQHIMSSIERVLIEQGDYEVLDSWGLRYINNNGYQNAYSANVGIENEIPEDAKEWGWGDTDYLAGGFDTGLNNAHFQGFNDADSSVSRNRMQRAHHGYFHWGSEHVSDVPGTDAHGGIEIMNKLVHADPIRSLNDGLHGSPAYTTSINTKADEFWRQMAGRQDFFIDACTAYSWTGREQDRPGGYFGGNLFQGPLTPLTEMLYGTLEPGTWRGPQGLSALDYAGWLALLPFGINARDAEEKAWQGAPPWNGHPNLTGNMHKGYGMPSRGIWNGGKCMDISWTGMGTGFNGSNWPNNDGDQPFPHQLKDVNTDIHQAAWRFIKKLVEVGTVFKFNKDPDDTLYTVSSFKNYPAYGYPEEGQGNAFFRPGTNEETGAWGIRNFCTHGLISQAAEALFHMGSKGQYKGENMRQRWTIMVTPAIGSGPSGYRPDMGTALGADTTVTALRHDGTQQDVIEIMTRYTSEREGSYYTDNPAVWETEPKEDVELDIYWEASPKIPLYVNKESQENFIQRGDVFRFYDNTGSQATEQLYKVLSWTNDNTIQFTAVGSWPTTITGTSAAVTDPVIEVTKRNHHTFRMKVEPGTYNIGTSVLKLVGTPYTDPLDLPSAQQQYLDWSNCYAFGNGVESDRIRDDFNAPQIDNGVKASTTLAEPVREERKTSGLIWSGLYNDTSNVNNLNQFIDGLKITKDLNPAHGSIQALLNRETRLAIFCEDRVLRAETNRDLLFNADGNPQVVASNAVVGDVIAYQGNYGISKNPESLVATPYAAYFTDVNRGHVLRLTTEGVASISDVGMSDYFADLFGNDLSKCIGYYDELKKEYNLTVHKYYFNWSSLVRPISSTTITYAETSPGWVSFKSFIAEDGVTLNNKLFTFYNGHIWKHHATMAEDGSNVDRNNFYGTGYTSTINVPFNEAPQSVKSFGTINYEGSIAKITNFDTEDAHFAGTTTDNWLTGVYSDNDGIEAGRTVTDGEYYNIEDTINGWYVESITTNLQTTGVIEFKDKEGKYYGKITGNATNLDNLDEREFSVQGLGSAVMAHSNPSLGESGTITVANNTSTTYEGSDGSGGAWDSAADNDNWSVNTGSFDATIGVAESAQQIDLTISPTAVGGGASPYNITASNFKIGGASQGSGSTTLENTWTGGNVDGDIIKVVFSDNNDNAGTVNAKVYIDSFTPANLNTLYVDIDEDATTPPTITEDRNVCLRVNHTPATGSSAAYTDVDGTTIAESIDYDTASLYRSKHSGIVQSDTTTLVAKYTFTASAGYVYNTMPTVTFNSLSSNTTSENYEGCYTSSITPTYVSSSSNISSFIVEISYTPPSNPLLYPDPIIDDFCKQQHSAFISYSVVSTTTNRVADNTITTTDIPSAAPYYGGAIPITVYGTSGAKYRIYVQKKTSLTDAATVASGYYNWPDAKFSTVDVSGENNQLVGTIDANGRNRHVVKLPEVTSDTRYDVYLDNVTTGTRATLGSSIPTVDGDASITQYGTRTATFAPTTYDASLYGTLPANVTITRPYSYDGVIGKAVYYETKVTSGPASSASTRLILQKTKAATRKMQGIKAGQYVIGSGVAHNTTVVDIKENIVTLSAAATVTAGTVLTFVKANAAVKPFSFAIVENGDGDDLSATAGKTLENHVGGFRTSFVAAANGARTNSTVVLDSTVGIYAGMSVSGDDIPEGTVVSSVTNSTTIVLDRTVTVTDDQPLGFSGGDYANSGIKIIDMQLNVAGAPTVATISGYLRVDRIDNTITHPIYIDNIITSA